jgi:hypothetical protein
VFAAACVLVSGSARAEDASPSPLTIVALAGTPFSSVRGRWSFASWLASGPRFDLVETAALRTGLETRAIAYEGSRLAVYTELYLARAFGVTAVSTWDAEVNQWLRIAFDDRWAGSLRAGVIGYTAGEPSQRGVVGLATLGARYRLDASFELGAELGWMGNMHSTRPLLSIAIEHHF